MFMESFIYGNSRLYAPSVCQKAFLKELRQYLNISQKSHPEISLAGRKMDLDQLKLDIKPFFDYVKDQAKEDPKSFKLLNHCLQSFYSQLNQPCPAMMLVDGDCFPMHKVDEKPWASLEDRWASAELEFGAHCIQDLKKLGIYFAAIAIIMTMDDQDKLIPGLELLKLLRELPKVKEKTWLIGSNNLADTLDKLITQVSGVIAIPIEEALVPKTASLWPMHPALAEKLNPSGWTVVER